MAWGETPARAARVRPATGPRSSQAAEITLRERQGRAHFHISEPGPTPAVETKEGREHSRFDGSPVPGEAAP